ncbi:MAG: type I-E CRISPR-associated protein Cse1/CasA, partial [Pontibacterium sp.]
MNLLTSSWVPMRLRDGSIKSLPVKYLADPDVVDLAFPRADFQGAAYQLLIGLLQTTYAPDDTDAWVELFELPPTLDKLEATFCAVKHAFNVSGDGALFMQDLDLLEETKSTTVSGLLIEAPGGNALKLNTDHFVKRGVGKCMSLEMAVMALFTLQINAPTGGQGHRTGLRGGGPLTTLIMSKNTAASLWEKLWLNVINREHWQYDDPDFHSGELFPWLVPTKTSESKNSEVYAEDVHPLHMFWATPRRIRLLPEEGEARCDISGELSTLFVTAYKTKNYGCNYSGTWSHPLTPYGYNPKKPDEDHLSVKGQSGGVTYKIWDLLTLQSKEEGQIPAKVISHLSELLEEFDDLEEQIRLWVFAYDMDNMKACGFYSVEMPFFNVPDAKRVRFFLEVKRLQKLSSEILWSCNSNIK